MLNRFFVLIVIVYYCTTLLNTSIVENCVLHTCFTNTDNRNIEFTYFREREERYGGRTTVSGGETGCARQRLSLPTHKRPPWRP
ncbi:hypothetical protein Hdeb2414_s0167g00820881 [Helianthus debilis subsp. tardiflorus]